MLHEEEPTHLPASVFPSGLLVVENPGAGGEHDVSELTRREQVVDPLLHIPEPQVKPGANDANLVDAPDQ